MAADAFLSHVAGHAGIPVVDADHVARTVLSGLGGYLTTSQRDLVADELPAVLGAALSESASIAVPIEERLLAAGMSASRAHELVASVCRVLGEELSTQALLVLRQAVPRPIAELLTWPSIETAARPERRHDSTLASGRPGSRHPISESPPPVAQTGSIAETNPHGPAKLSSASGTTQERRHETLAEARPGEKHTLAGK